MVTEPNEPINAVVEENYNHEQGRGYLEARYNGLTKREYFAAMAMQGLCVVGGNDFNGAHNQRIAEIAVNQADWLINALNK